MEALQETMIESAAMYIGWGGLIIGIVFGFIVYRTNFCTMGSISDILSFGDYKRFRAWLLASATAIIGVALLERGEIADMNMSMYQTTSLAWGGHIVGGLLFGFGMVFAGGCVSRNLVRAGGGDLRSIVVLMFTGVFGYMTIGGLLGPLRVALFTPMTADLSESMDDQRIGSLVSSITGLGWDIANLVTIIVIAGGILVYCFMDKDFRNSGNHMIAGIGIGLCVVAGWALTGLTYDEFADNPQLISLSYVRPSGDTLDYLMRYTALGAPNFGVVTLAGAMIGGFIGALSRGRLHLTTFADQSDSIRNMFGAALMGIGGVLALGCTVGQALTGFSTLAIGSLITFIFIVVGGIAGVKTMETLA
ncbi:MAG: YeeE/YedE family protein [Paracoccaceae bacterium]|nr:YeeE/YedE family protein [Paracoccaceae bacterium]MDG2258011.1 YeeE/YedE family protein [Paracoccaceae bacterium]